MSSESTNNLLFSITHKEIPELISQLRGLIESARGQALRAVDSIQVRTCWEIGRHIVEFEQQGQDRAAYGAPLIPRLAETLTAEFGRGFDASNLRYMRLFYMAFPIRDALRHELSWTHYRNLLRVENEQARNWYMDKAANQNWSTRARERQIGTLYYERLLASRDREPVRNEAAAQIAPLQQTPREFMRDPVLLEFLGLPESGRLLEAELEQALINKLQGFLLELGKGFAFVARQMRISAETKDFFIDLVFYNYLLKCFVLFDLKSGDLTHQDIGQMDMYVRMVDDLKRAPDDNPTVGIILCAGKDAAVVRYSVLHENEKLFASKYKLVLPSEDELRAELEKEQLWLTEQKEVREKMSSNIKKVPSPLAVTNDLAAVVGQPSQMASSSIREGWGEGALASTAKASDTAICVSNLSKCYHIYDNPRDRLKQFVVPKLCRAVPALRKLFPTNHSGFPFAGA